MLSKDRRFQNPSQLLKMGKVSWGRLLLKSVLKSADITYSLFNPDGSPLRASIKATFSKITEDELRVAEEDRSSPDLTHRRTVQEGDTLPLMTHKMYGDHTHYVAVARYNRLLDFRRLEPGTQIAFPPVEDLPTDETESAAGGAE